MMKQIFFLCCLIGILDKAVSQDSLQKQISRNELLFTGSHFSFSIIPLVNQEAEIRPQSGPFALGSRVVRGIQAGFNYHNILGEQFSLILGLHGGASVRNYTLFIPKTDFTPIEQEHYIQMAKSTETVDFYLSAPVWIEKRWLNRNKSYWNALLGLSLKFYPDQFSHGITHLKLDPNGNYYDIIELDLEVGRNYKPWIDYNFGGGYAWILRNGNLISSNILVNISNKSITQGTYQIQVPGKPISEGYYKSRHSFIGLSVNYIFTAANKRLRKLSQNNYQE